MCTYIEVNIQSQQFVKCASGKRYSYNFIKKVVRRNPLSEGSLMFKCKNVKDVELLMFFSTHHLIICVKILTRNVKTMKMNYALGMCYCEDVQNMSKLPAECQ